MVEDLVQVHCFVSKELGYFQEYLWNYEPNERVKAREMPDLRCVYIIAWFDRKTMC